MTPTLAAVASGDLSAFAGAQIAGTIPIRETLLNTAAKQAIASKPGRVKDVELRIGSGNLLEIGVRIAVGPFAKWFRPEVIVTPQVLTSRGPVLVLTIASSEYVGLMWIARLFATDYFPKGVSIDGRQIAVDLAAVSQVGAARGLLHTLRNLTVRTAPGVIRIDFDVKVDQA